jgi:hypothetical protein
LTKNGGSSGVRHVFQRDSEFPAPCFDLWISDIHDVHICGVESVSFVSGVVGVEIFGFEQFGMQVWCSFMWVIANYSVNRLSFYPMIHLSVFHLVLNIWALVPLLSAFELTNGTVRTGIVLNSMFGR